MADSAVDPASQGLAVHEELFVPGGRFIGKPENFYGKISEICQMAEKADLDLLAYRLLEYRL